MCTLETCSPACTRFQPLCLLSEIPLWAKRAWVETLKLRINAGRSSEKVREELMDLLCVQTTAFAKCVSRRLHAKRTTSAEVVVVVVEGSRSRSQAGLNCIKRRRASHGPPPPRIATRHVALVRSIVHRSIQTDSMMLVPILITLPPAFQVTLKLCAFGLVMLSGMFRTFSTVYRYSQVYAQ